MILAAGLGTRMRPLSDLRAKPALPVRGIPVIAYLLELLMSHGVREVIVNVHHRPETVRDAVREFTPHGMDVTFSWEPEPLGTGGGIRKARDFLMESDPCLVLAGDMLLDVDLTELISRHRQRGDLATLVLLEDSRVGRFGSIGVAKGGEVRRIANSFDLGNEHASGIFTGVRILSKNALESLPTRDSFEDLRDWIVPMLEDGNHSVTGHLLTRERCTWEPVGEPGEYLRANLHPPALSFFDYDAHARQRGVTFDGTLVIGADAKVDPSAQLARCVVWDGETVPTGTTASDGVFAQGRFIACEAPA
jgi:mannose-1-phosphate guanylyltransferase